MSYVNVDIGSCGGCGGLAGRVTAPPAVESFTAIGPGVSIPGPPARDTYPEAAATQDIPETHLERLVASNTKSGLPGNINQSGPGQMSREDAAKAKPAAPQKTYTYGGFDPTKKVGGQEATLPKGGGSTGDTTPPPAKKTAAQLAQATLLADCKANGGTSGVFAVGHSLAGLHYCRYSASVTMVVLADGSYKQYSDSVFSGKPAPQPKKGNALLLIAAAVAASQLL